MGDGRRCQNVIAEDGEILQAFRLCLQDRDRRWRRRRLKADGEKDHLPLRVFPRNPQRILGRIDHPDIAPSALARIRLFCLVPGTRIMSP